MDFVLPPTRNFFEILQTLTLGCDTLCFSLDTYHYPLASLELPPSFPFSEWIWRSILSETRPISTCDTSRSHIILY